MGFARKGGVVSASSAEWGAIQGSLSKPCRKVNTKIKGDEKMKQKNRILLVMLVVFSTVAILSAHVALANKDKGNGDNQGGQSVYSAKYICGMPPINSTTGFGPLVPANYTTAINVHNPNNFNVTLTKKVALAGNESNLIKPSAPLQLVLPPDFAVEIDCSEIAGILNFTAPSFSKGFVVIETPNGQQLDVVGVYTSISSTNDITLDTQEITPKSITTQNEED